MNEITSENTGCAYKNLDTKAIDTLLYGWGEWRRRKAEINGYAKTTMTGKLIEGAIGFGSSVMRSLIPRGVEFERDNRAAVYAIIDEFYGALGDRSKLVMGAVYIAPGRHTSEQMAEALGMSERTLSRTRSEIRADAGVRIHYSVFYA